MPEERLTPVERSDFRSTPGYEETLAYLRRLEARLPQMKLSFFGTSAEGRPLPVVVVSKEKAFSPQAASALARKAGKPILMIQNGIHSGEIDGKDACLLLLRDLALGREEGLLDAATLVIVPIYNVDGHERVSPYNRPNQEGPAEGMGFRTTASGLDLNRDHLKLASQEAQALIGLVSRWRPHLHVDNHVTDGSDHAWVLTYSWAEVPQLAPPLDAWMRAWMPRVLQDTEKAGHRLGPYVSLVDRSDPAKGFDSRVTEPRYATGYYPLRQRPSILVEMHSYKPYRDRVLANRDFLEALIRRLAVGGKELVEAVTEAEEAEVARGRFGAEPSQVVLTYESVEEPDRIILPVYAWETQTSEVLGGPMLTYRRGEVRDLEVDWFHRLRAGKTVPRPRGYLVLPGWPQIEERLRGHGLRVRRLSAPQELEVETLRLNGESPAPRSYQGQHRLEAQVVRKVESVKLPAGTLWVPADQPDFELAVQLLEPEAPDSLVSWGYLSSVSERKEYIEPRILEQLARQMLRDPATEAAWREALEDPDLASDGQARYLWWYRRTPYWDDRVGLLPIFRLIASTPFAGEPSASEPIASEPWP